MFAFAITMNNEHIERVLKLSLCGSERKGEFLGVFPIDRLAKIKLYKPGRLRICILNTDPAKLPGRHWFLFGIDCRNSSSNEQYHAFIFDSLAQCEKYTTVWNYLTTSTTLSHLLFNKQVVQDMQVDSCALHVIYFTTMMLRNGFSFSETMCTYNVHEPLLNDCKLIENILEFLFCENNLLLANEIQQNLPDTLFLCARGGHK
jgi:hypothetical protein